MTAVARPTSAPGAPAPGADLAVARAGRGREQDQSATATQWPPERTAAVRLVRARDTVTRAATTGDPRAQALARRHIDAVEADARTYLSRPADIGGDRDEQAASARARAGLARMLDPDPVTRAAGTDDLTRAWPAEHLDVLRTWAEHHRNGTETGRDRAADDDVVARARHAVASIPAPATDAADAEVAAGLYPDVELDGHRYRDPVIDDHADGDPVDSSAADADIRRLSMTPAAGQ